MGAKLKRTFRKLQPGCQMLDCPRPNPNDCLRCGFMGAEHARRVDAIHRQGLRMDGATGLLYLPVTRHKAAPDA